MKILSFQFRSSQKLCVPFICVSELTTSLFIKTVLKLLYMSLATKFPRITPVGNATNSKLHSSNKTKENCFSLPIPNTFSMPYCEKSF